MCISAWRRYWPVRPCQSCQSHTPDDTKPFTLRYHFTGRFWDILRDLAEVGSFPESHANSPVNNNKRVHGSDEPAESPPPDDTSKASSRGRGPVQGSKRVSRTLGSSTINDTATSSPASLTYDIRGDLAISPAAGTVSTPERTDSLEISDSPSPGALTRIFNGDTMPITTNDLGRLPLHHGVKFPANFNTGDTASGWNAVGAEPSHGLTQGDLNTRGTQTGVIPGIHPPQDQHPEDLFPWMLYTTMLGPEEPPTNSDPALATASKPNVAPGYVAANSSQAQQGADRVDPTMSSLFGDITSSTALGQAAGLLPGPVPNATQDHTGLFDTLFPLSGPPVGTHPPTNQQPHEAREEPGYGSLPINAQAYLHGWSNVPQAFE